MKFKIAALIISITTPFCSKAEEVPFSSYLDCAFLAKALIDFEKEKYFEEKAMETLMKEHKGKSRDELKNIFTTNFYYKKGYIEGAINTLSYDKKVNKGTAAGILNQDNYCKHFKW